MSDPVPDVPAIKRVHYFDRRKLVLFFVGLAVWTGMFVAACVWIGNAP